MGPGHSVAPRMAGPSFARGTRIFDGPVRFRPGVVYTRRRAGGPAPEPAADRARVLRFRPGVVYARRRARGPGGSRSHQACASATATEARQIRPTPAAAMEPMGVGQRRRARPSARRRRLSRQRRARCPRHCCRLLQVDHHHHNVARKLRQLCAEAYALRSRRGLEAMPRRRPGRSS